MSRSLKKGFPFVDEKLKKKIYKQIKEKKIGLYNIRTWSRNSEIQPYFVGCKFEVHNGKNFTLFEITKDMVGHKLGEYSITRKYAAVKHKKVKKKVITKR